MRFFNSHNQRVMLLALAAMLIPAGFARADDNRVPDAYVLSVGIDNYLYNCSLNGDVNDAINNTNAFVAQKGKKFNNVYQNTMVDAQATHANISKQLQDFSRLGKAGDTFVIFLSGRAGTYANDGSWYFAAYDECSANNDGDLSDKELLTASDVLVKQGKNVVIIADASYSGRLGQAAQNFLNAYQNPKGGSLVLAMSSSPMQESQTLGGYSPFAQAFADGINGAADQNHDGKITLQELKSYTYDRAYDLLRMNCNYHLQDGQILWSQSLTPNSAMALTQARAQAAN